MKRWIIAITVGALACGTVQAQQIAGWHKVRNDSVKGANIAAALSFIDYQRISPPLSASLTVGVLDSGIDTACVSLQPYLWHNPGEKNNGKDNDGNGYAADVIGWNLLGTRDGSFNMTSAGTEEYREFKRLYPKYKDTKTAPADSAEYAYYQLMRRKAGINGYLMYYETTRQKAIFISRADSLLRADSRIDLDTLRLKRLPTLPISHPEWETMLQAMLIDMVKAADTTTWCAYRTRQASELALMRRRIDGIEHDSDKRLLMGDNMADASDIYYGNNVLTVEGCEHGNFVSSIIASQPADSRYGGICNGRVRLMNVRCVADGDEYDKDVATAIRYAVDNGARVINMSLGKYTSPDAAMVNDAIAYARAHDVLIVAAAGNDHRNIDATDYYPKALSADGQPFDNYIRVGASAIDGSISRISNYGQRSVDVYAPGENIAGVYPADKCDLADGTSVATPIVTAVAALLRSYFPLLTAADVKSIIVETAWHPAGAEHGIVDALAAVKLAQERVACRYADRQESIAEAYGRVSISPQWIDDSPYIYYMKQQNGTTHYYMVDARNGRTEEMIKDVESFAKQYAQLSGQNVTPQSYRLYGVSLKEKGNAGTICWKRGEKSYCYNRRTGRLSEQATAAKERGKRISLSSHTTADSLFTMMGDRYDIYIHNNTTGTTRRLTTDGRENSTYCYRSATDSVSPRNASGSWHGHVYINVVYDDSRVGDLYLIDALGKKRPQLRTKKMPLPAEEGVRQFKIYWYNADTDTGRLLPIERFKDQNVAIGHYTTDREMYFTRRSRGVDTIDLCRIDMATGEVKQLITETSKPHLNVTSFNYRIINGGRHILWWSERTGRGNYYLYDRDGRLLNRVTQGDDIVADGVERIDSVGQQIVFAAHKAQGGYDPCYTYYYKVRLDGTHQQQLTTADATHKLTLSKDGRYAIDTYSRADLPPVYAAVSLSGAAGSHDFYRTPADTLKAAGWRAPELFSVKAADDSTMLYGMMYRPTDFSEERLYPIISNVYPGPQDDQIERTFAVNDNANQTLADMGFIVINVAPRGSSPWRGHDFYCYGYGNLRDYPVADDRHAIEQLAARYSYIDLNRVGIYGHSGGGAMTATAMLTYPDFYKVGVSASGNHDNNIYIQWWGETFHGLTRQGGIPTNAQLASRLKGHLLLISGDADDNVPWASTLRLADALIRSNKKFDIMIFPGVDHAMAGAYYEKLIRNYFVEHLLHE
jgi:dipeptidyl aminopeptidase/acylaminoacyl peptidase/subtilisin family serine protease